MSANIFDDDGFPPTDGDGGSAARVFPQEPDNDADVSAIPPDVALSSSPVVVKVLSMESVDSRGSTDSGGRAARARRALRDAAVQTVLLDSALCHYHAAMGQLESAPGPAGLGCDPALGGDPVRNLRQAASLLLAASDVLSDRRTEALLPDPGDDAGLTN